MLKNSAVRFAGEKPEPGRHLGMIVSEALIPSALGEAADETVQAALGVHRLDMKRDVLADDGVKRNRVVLRKQLQLKTEQLRDGFLARDAARQQDVRAEGRVNSQRPLSLRESNRCHTSLS